MQKLLQEIDALQAEIRTLRPFSEHQLKLIREYYRIGLTYSSNALEGNTLTESETKIVLENGITIGGKPLRDHLEVMGHAKAYDFVHTLMNQQDFDEADLKKVHALFYATIDADQAGKYRTEKVILTGSKYPLPGPSQLPALIQRFFSELHTHTQHPVIKSAWVHLRLVLIHPFVDGNGRTSRLLMNLILLQHDYSVAVIPPVVRQTYIDFLERAHEDPAPFYGFIAERVRETQKDFLRLFDPIYG
jgi:Fic family protein